jgi:hypothetical protein
MLPLPHQLIKKKQKFCKFPQQYPIIFVWFVWFVVNYLFLTPTPITPQTHPTKLIPKKHRFHITPIQLGDFFSHKIPSKKTQTGLAKHSVRVAKTNSFFRVVRG